MDHPSGTSEMGFELSMLREETVSKHGKGKAMKNVCEELPDKGVPLSG